VSVIGMCEGQSKGDTGYPGACLKDYPPVDRGVLLERAVPEANSSKIYADGDLVHSGEAVPPLNL
jgi:hypothetical protein